MILPMDLKELKGTQLRWTIRLRFQSLMKFGNKSITTDLCVRIAKLTQSFGSENTLSKTRTGDVKRQRYRCKSCRQTFNDLTNTPIQRTRRPHGRL
jgi:transposase-like protein